MNKRNSGPRASRGLRNRYLAVTLASIATAALVGLVASTSGQSVSSASVAPCAPRLVEVDLSSLARSPELANFADQLIMASAESSIVCDSTPLSVVGVAGGGDYRMILDSADLASLTPLGPNPTIRSARFSANDRSELSRLVSHDLLAAYRATTSDTTSSVEAFYVLAAQEPSPTHIIAVTPGVDVGPVNLNRPLAAGDGVRAASSVSVPRLPKGDTFTEVGIGQVDATVPAPSTTWIDEIENFNHALCLKATHDLTSCHLLSVATTSQVLDPLN